MLLRGRVCSLLQLLTPWTDFVTTTRLSIQVKKVGIVVRKGRRKIANLDSFMGGLEEVGARWCRTALLSGRCEVQFRGEEFGLERGGREGRGSGSSSSSVERDIVPLQEYAVLFGIQVHESLLAFLQLHTLSIFL